MGVVLIVAAGAYYFTEMQTYMYLLLPMGHLTLFLSPRLKIDFYMGWMALCLCAVEGLLGLSAYVRFQRQEKDN